MEQLESVLIVADIITAIAKKSEDQTKQNFIRLVESAGYKYKGVELDMNAVSEKAATLLRKIANGEEDIKSDLQTIASVLGLTVVDAETEEGNELPV
jgi:hypothetical protein